MTKCPACLEVFGPGGYRGLASHLTTKAEESDSTHVRWLNQNVGYRKVETAQIEVTLRKTFELGGGTLKQWVHRRFIAKFFGDQPHPFVVALQHPSRETLIGYAIEHQHFLRQWVRSCAYIIARTDDPAVIRYELDNLGTEYGGMGSAETPHYELLLRMGESLGIPRERILSTPPLPATERSIEAWNHVSQSEPWVEAMAAMHGLELIAHRDLLREGASVHYFDPRILQDGSVTAAARDFLREGYEADIGHSDEALDLVAAHARDPGTIEAVQGTFLHSLDLFDDYLIARLERGSQFEARS